MRIVFMGTSEIAAIILSALNDHHEIAAVYTKPDAVRSRGRRATPTPVSELAAELGIPIETPVTLNDDETLGKLSSYSPEVICVCAYGMLLKAAVLSLPPHGCLNVHASLLPRWRGAAPIERAILAGDAKTGVSIMKMTEQLDAGPTCVCSTIEIGTKNRAHLATEIADAGARSLIEALDRIEAGTIQWTVQAQGGILYADKLVKGELNISPADSVEQAARKVRASSSAHPSKCIIGLRSLTVLDVQTAYDHRRAGDCAIPSELPSLGKVALVLGKLLVGLSDGALEIVRVKPDGKKEMDAKAFAAGIHDIKSGDVLWGAIDG